MRARFEEKKAHFVGIIGKTSETQAMPLSKEGAEKVLEEKRELIVEPGENIAGWLRR
jgi:hypothetical protein